jgi:hypothetical protein
MKFTIIACGLVSLSLAGSNQINENWHDNRQGIITMPTVNPHSNEGYHQ